jgi:long-chain acyl-CoA synthetase
MSIDRPWLASYPANVPAQVNVDEFPSIVSVLEQACERFRDNPAFTNFGTALSYDDIDRSAPASPPTCWRTQAQEGRPRRLMMPNVLQYPIAIFGVLRAGLTVVNTNPCTPRASCGTS